MNNKFIRQGYSNYNNYTNISQKSQDLIFAAYKRVIFNPELAPDKNCVSSNINYLQTGLMPVLGVLGELLDLQQFLKDIEMLEVKVKRAEHFSYSCWPINRTEFTFESPKACTNFVDTVPLSLSVDFVVTGNNFHLNTVKNHVSFILNLLKINLGVELRSFKLTGFTSEQVDLEILKLRSNIERNLGADLTTLDLINNLNL